MFEKKVLIVDSTLDIYVQFMSRSFEVKSRSSQLSTIFRLEVSYHSEYIQSFPFQISNINISIFRIAEMSIFQFCFQFSGTQYSTYSRVDLVQRFFLRSWRWFRHNCLKSIHKLTLMSSWGDILYNFKSLASLSIMHLNSNLASSLLEVFVLILCFVHSNIASNFLISGISKFLSQKNWVMLRCS